MAETNSLTGAIGFFLGAVGLLGIAVAVWRGREGAIKLLRSRVMRLALVLIGVGLAASLHSAVGHGDALQIVGIVLDLLLLAVIGWRFRLAAERRS